VKVDPEKAVVEFVIVSTGKDMRREDLANGQVASSYTCGDKMKNMDETQPAR